MYIDHSCFERLTRFTFFLFLRKYAFLIFYSLNDDLKRFKRFLFVGKRVFEVFIFKRSEQLWYKLVVFLLNKLVVKGDMYVNVFLTRDVI